MNRPTKRKQRASPLWQRIVYGIVGVFTGTLLQAEDWPMYGRDRTRNPVSPEQGAPMEWDVKTGRNIKWKAKLGSMTFSDPVIANGVVWIRANNAVPRDPSVKQEAAILMCFSESDGKFMYQYVVSTKPGPLYPVSRLGFNGSPLIEGKRLWLTTLAGVVECLDLAPLLAGWPTPKSVWKVDLPEEFGVYPRYPYMADGRTCSLGASYKNRMVRRRGIHQGDPQPCAALMVNPVPYFCRTQVSLLSLPKRECPRVCLMSVRLG